MTHIALQVGVQFVKEYYGKMSREPEQLLAMYAKDSTMTNITGSGGSAVRSVGQEEIQEKLATWTKEGDRKFTISSIEASPCHGEGFFIHVKGVLLTREAERQFTHIFVLGKSQANYYISVDFFEVGDNTRTQSPVEAWTGQGEYDTTTKQPVEAVSPTPTPKQQPEAFTALEPTTDDVPPVPEEPVPVVVTQPVVPAAIEEEEQAQEEVRQEEPVQEEVVEVEHEEPEEEAAAEEEEVVTEEPVQEQIVEPEPELSAPVAQAEPEVAEEPVTADDDAGAPSSWLSMLKGGSRGQPAQRGPGTKVVGGRVPQAARYEPQPVQKKEETTRPQGTRRPAGDRPAAEAKPKSPRRAPGGAGLDSRYKYPALYVSKIPPAMTEQEIDDLFSKYGKVISKTLKREQHCCFIDFADRAAIDKALADTQFVGDVRLHVQERMSPEERAKQRDRQESKRGATGGSTAPRRQGGRQQGN